ncbi:MAG: DNA repair protein RadC [Duncaniella sp.]|nr:DNA repair protein RadC [Duncaniella sp.]
MKIHELHPDDKPREKALSKGIGTLSDAELLAIIFGGGLPGMSVIEMSQNVLRDCENRLDRLSRQSPQEMMRKYKGVGEAKAVSLAAAFELGRRNAGRTPEIDPQIKCSADIASLMRPKIGHIPHEEFWVLMLSRANRVIRQCLISSGGTTATVVDSKIILKQALDCLAEGMILVHNHPSGNLQPSGQDDSLTHRIVEGAKCIGFRVLDHVIVTASSHYSYADENRL